MEISVSNRHARVEVLPRSGGSGVEHADTRLIAFQEPLRRMESLLDSFIGSARLPADLEAAVRYSLLEGGKRLRPMLAIGSCQTSGGDISGAIVAGAAVEMIHGFSLVHDDLPALDNDDLRRGRPTCHKAHGEAMAILAGDGLMSMAFELISQHIPDRALSGLLAGELALGTTRMIAGQVYDTFRTFPEGLSELQRLQLIHRNKTGALITAACRMGAMSGAGPAGLPERKLELMTRFGEAVGLMFQIKDDLLDEEQSSEHLGKRSGKDREAGKITYPGLLGVERSRTEVLRLRAEAEACLAPFGDAAQPLLDLCFVLSERTR